MPKTFLAVFVAITIAFTGCFSASKPANTQTIRVLFIGNSLTFANDLPNMIADIAESHGNEMIYDSYTQGGARLAQHASNIDVLMKLRAQLWDFVVLQEQSQYPGFSPSQLSIDVFPHAKRLTEAIKRTHQDTSVVFYMTMARRNGDPENRHVSAELLTYEGMQKRVNSAYLEMAQDNNGLIAPVGKVWEIIRQQRPEINLYADDVHPNETGTYLAASVFYATLFQSPSLDSSVPPQVDAEIAQYIQNVADKTVLEPAEQWDWR